MNASSSVGQRVRSLSAVAASVVVAVVAIGLVTPRPAEAVDADLNGKTDITSCADLFSMLAGGTSASPKTGSYELLPAGSTMDCTSVTQAPLAYFSGSLDGNGVTITGIDITCGTGVCGLFGYLVGSAAISNLTISGASVTNTGTGIGTGALAGAVPGWGTSVGVTVTDVTISAGTITGAESTGSLIGWADYGVLTRINSSATVSASASTAVGGLVGDIGAQSTYSCSAGSPSLLESSFSGSVTGRSEVGGLTGRFEPNNGEANGCRIADSANSGSVHSTSTDHCTVGGLVGSLWESRVESSTNTGTVDANGCTGFSMKVGGVAGRVDGDFNVVSLLERVSNSASVSATATGARYVGGVAGYCGGNMKRISRSYNTGAISGDTEVGGVVGWQTTGCKVSDSFSHGVISATTYAGGVAGTLQSATIEKSYSQTVAKFLGQNASGMCNDSFYDSDRTSSISCLAGAGSAPLTGKTTTQMKTESTFTAAGWDFSCIAPTWAIDPTINDGYPFLVGVGPVAAPYTPSSLPVSISAASTSLGIGQTTTVTFSLCESSSTFDDTDVTVTGGATVSALAQSGTTYTATFTPPVEAAGTATISVAAGAFTDAANNPNGTGASLTIAFDTRTQAPVVTTTPTTPAVTPAPVPPAPTTTTTTTPPTTTTEPPVVAPEPVVPGQPVIVIDTPLQSGEALATRSDGQAVVAEVATRVLGNLSTITIRNSDGTELTVVHQPALIQSNYTVYRGTSLTISGDGYQPDTALRVWLNSTPTYLGETTTAADGSFTFEVIVPGDFDLGDHVLQVEGTVPDDVFQSTFLGLLVLDRSVGTLPSTGGSLPVGWAVMVAALGLALIVAGRRRAADRPTTGTV